jgi:putative copper export protein
MSFFTFCPWIETTSLSIAIREGALYCPILGTFHLAAIAWFGGMVLIGDLTVLRIGLREVSASQILEQFSRWKWVGFAVVIVSGGLLWWAEPIVCYNSVSFRIKIVLLLLVGLNSLVLRRTTYRQNARLTACASILLWLGLIFSGRGIAFF